MDDIEAKITFERVEVAVAVEERMAVSDAVGCNDAVDRLPYGRTAGSQESIVPCGGNGCFLATGIEYGKGIQLPCNVSAGFFVSKSL